VSISQVPEIWAGMECTVNRVQHGYFDQLGATGHDAREDDLDRFAALGIRTLRYPVLWERVMPTGGGASRWEWCDRRMARLRHLGIRPVVGLMHHGSGPTHTSLVDALFPEHFERYAQAAAQRFPWAPLWILINEPLTTARFSCLYGHWYPHQRNDHLFARAIVGQCLAIARAAAAIRRVNHEARLIQSEDLSRTHSTPLLSYQAEMENERRWLTFDLLCGRVRRGHIMWDWLRGSGADPEDLAWLEDHPSPPDLLGVNHYLTSERFLDERMERYPARWHGGNGLHRYADVEAVRVCEEGPAGIGALMREVWQRYRIPIAITEVHLDCTRDEQLRWVTEVRDVSEDLCREGIPVVALTIWSLLGSYNWNELLTGPRNYYESGVFDVRGGTPRETRLATLVRCWTSGRAFAHPVLEGEGWWHRPVRLLYPAVSRGGTLSSRRRKCPTHIRSIAIVGATLAVRREFERAAHLRDLPMQFVSSADAERSVDDGAWAIVFAGLVNELREEFCANPALDAARTSALARVAAERGCHVTLLSSQEVFGSLRDTPYVETDEPRPLTLPGRLALDMELALRAIGSRVLVVRSAPCFATREERASAGDIDWRFPADATLDAAASLTYLPDLVRQMLDLIIDGEDGIWHLANSGSIPLADVMGMAAETTATPSWSMQAPAGVPAYLLGTIRGPLLPVLGEALGRAGYASSLAPSRMSASR
jgi:dTDP-4-dehydrorhamnose reductase